MNWPISGEIYQKDLLEKESPPIHLIVLALSWQHDDLISKELAEKYQVCKTSSPDKIRKYYDKLRRKDFYYGDIYNDEGDHFPPDISVVNDGVIKELGKNFLRWVPSPLGTKTEYSSGCFSYHVYFISITPYDAGADKKRPLVKMVKVYTIDIRDYETSTWYKKISPLEETDQVPTLLMILGRHPEIIPDLVDQFGVDSIMDAIGYDLLLGTFVY